MMASLGRAIASVNLTWDMPVCIANFDRHSMPDGAPRCLPGHVCQGSHSRILRGLDVP